VPLELDPPQPDPVVDAIARLLDGGDRDVGADPWWEAGLAEALRGGDGPSAQDTWGGAGVVEP
jgi:hypothetical protein